MKKVELINRIKALNPKLNSGILWTNTKRYLEQKLEIMEELYADYNNQQ